MRGITSIAAIAAIFGLLRPAAATLPDDLCAPAADPCVVNTALTLTPGSVIDLGERALQFGPAARVVFLLQGRDLITNDLVRANGGSQSMGGVIALQGCNVTVSQSSDIRALGQNRSNTITGSGQITIRGKMTTAAGGTNPIVYRDPSMPPSITGTVSPAP
jgi:hypothetical protein